MVKVQYYDKEFISRKSCVDYFELSYSAVVKPTYKKLTFKESLDAQLIAKLFNMNIRIVFLNKLYLNETYIRTIENYVNNLEKPTIEQTKRAILRTDFNTYGIGFYYDDVFYTSVREYCEKFNVSYLRVMKYRSRHHCSPKNAIDALKRIDNEKDKLIICEQFNITPFTYNKLVKDYGNKFFYYMDVLIEENLQDRFKTIKLSTFIKLAILKDIGNSYKEIGELLKFIVDNNLQDKNVYKMNLYSYGGFTCTSLKSLCEKWELSYNTVRQLMRTENMDYKEAISHIFKKKNRYSYKGKRFIGFTQLCREFNVSYEAAMKLHQRCGISKMEAFKKLIEKK